MRTRRSELTVTQAVLIGILCGIGLSIAAIYVGSVL